MLSLRSPERAQEYRRKDQDVCSERRHWRRTRLQQSGCIDIRFRRRA
jgi:hypothetical protein